jgi:hypothetical protein
MIIREYIICLRVYHRTEGRGCEYDVILVAMVLLQ